MRVLQLGHFDIGDLSIEAASTSKMRFDNVAASSTELQGWTTSFFDPDQLVP
jgi:hypothetical protein